MVNLNSEEDYLEKKENTKFYAPFILGVCSISFFVLGNMMAYFFNAMPSSSLFIFCCSFICNLAGFLFLFRHKKINTKLGVLVNDNYKVSKKILIIGFVLQVINVLFYIFILFFVVFKEFRR